MTASSVYRYGGHGPVVHLAQANGFPPATYRQLALSLTDRYELLALLPRPLWPGSSPASAPSWHTLAEDLVAGLDGLGLRGIAAVGHSIGGVLTLWSAVRRPDLFRAVVIVDPVILPPSWLRLVRMERVLGLQPRPSLVRGALRRRRVWPSHQACFDHYRTKPLFARWPDATLWDYVQGGTRTRDDGQVELLFPGEWEAHIFATVPTDVWHDVPRLRTPALIVRGQHSETFRPEVQARMVRLLPQACFITIPDAGHLVPMERPPEVGAAICDFLDAVGY